MIETNITKRERSGAATSFAGPESAFPSRVIPAKAGIQKRLWSFDKNLCIQKTKKMDSRLRGNDKKSVGHIALGRQPRLASAFTMVELLVALLVMILLLGITAVIYKSSSDAITQTNASVAMYQDANTLTRQIDQAMQNIYTDGYLVIYGYDVRDETDYVAEKNPEGRIIFDDNELESVRSDAICFFTTGSFNSLVTQGVSANSGWVYFGHAGTVTPDTYGSSPFDNNSANDPLIANEWVLSKYQILFSPEVTPLTTFIFPASDIRKINTTVSTVVPTVGAMMKSMEYQFTSMAVTDIRDWFYNCWIYDYAGAVMGTPYFGTPPYIDFDNGVTFPYTLGNCGSFKIEFVMPKSYFVATDPKNEPDQYADDTIVWRNAIDLSPDNPENSSDHALDFLTGAPNPNNAGTLSATGRNGHRMVVFGPRDTWPLMIRFTLRKYDENLSIVSEEDFGGGVTHQHGGQTFEYTFKLPPKN